VIRWNLWTPHTIVKHSFLVVLYAFSAFAKVWLVYFITVPLVVERTTPRPMSVALVARDEHNMFLKLQLFFLAILVFLYLLFPKFFPKAMLGIGNLICIFATILDTYAILYYIVSTKLV